ncbi:hypothetical protein KY285_023692 [Solanum tuberosum]|nr:hypothetical protein KY289_024022 [Solanum tuberosum]KAH0675891.1 hypothetical protein KY285_023692 [Solanum tuberosum]
MAIYDWDRFSSLCNEKDVELKGTIIHFITPFLIGCPIREAKLRNAASRVEFSRFKENYSVFEKIHEELKARSMLRTAEETKKRLLSEKSSVEAKIVELEKKKSSEDGHA